jgi:hypothetical protein
VGRRGEDDKGREEKGRRGGGGGGMGMHGEYALVKFSDKPE